MKHKRIFKNPNDNNWLEVDNEYMPFIPNTPNHKEIYDKLNWITVDGRVLKIKNMTTNHIKACIDMISRKVGSCENSEKYKVYSNLVDEYCIRMGKSHLVRGEINEQFEFK